MAHYPPDQAPYEAGLNERLPCVLRHKHHGHGVYVEERTVDVHLSRLRKALDQAGNVPLPNLIRTVRGSGYALQSG